MFAYYAKWIPNFSDKIQPLVNATFFPLNKSALSAFKLLKNELERATLHSIDESQPCHFQQKTPRKHAPYAESVLS